MKRRANIPPCENSTLHKRVNSYMEPQPASYDYREWILGHGFHVIGRHQGLKNATGLWYFAGNAIHVRNSEKLPYETQVVDIIPP